MKLSNLFFAAILIAGFLLPARPMIRNAPYMYDEADYMFAASQGFAANYLDSPSQSFAEFLRTGLSHGRDAAQKAALSQSIRDSGDINFYRHWHGPLYYYWLVLLQPWKGSEYSVRALSLVFPALSILAIYFGCLSIFKRQDSALLAAALFGWSTVVTVSTELAPHELFVLIVICGLLSLAKWMESGNHRYWFASVVLSALAAATLEVGLILILTIAAIAYLERRRLQADWRFVRNSIAVLLISLVVVWPGALFRLAFLKAYIFMAYLALVRKSAWGATFSEAWGARLLLAPVEWLLLAFALFVWVRRKDLRDRRALPFLIFGTLMLLFLAKVNAAGARYMLPFLPAFDIFTAIMLGRWAGPRRGWMVATIACLLVVANTVRVERSREANIPDPRPRELLTQIRARNLTAKTLLIPHEDFPSLHYYFPNAHLIAYGENGDGPPANVPADAIVYPDYPVRVAPTTK